MLNNFICSFLSLVPFLLKLSLCEVSKASVGECKAMRLLLVRMDRLPPAQSLPLIFDNYVSIKFVEQEEHMAMLHVVGVG